MSKFQAIVIAIFVICIIAGVTLFATYKGRDSANVLPSISIWGTFPESVFPNLLTKINSGRDISLSVDYLEISEDSFDKTFIESLARGQGPDAILISQDMILRHADKLIPIPTDILTERDFKNTYIPQAELYFTNQGAIAIPFTVDPLVMYWNRDLFTNADLATYPKYWDEFANIGNLINLKDTNSNIRRSAIAMGEFVNINHAREILGALLLQAGNPVTLRGEDGVQSALGDGNGFSGTKYSSPAISFFAQFSNPRDPQYSWNRSLPMSKSWFLSGSLATYFGFSSELFDIRNKNPNIDFDVASLPQARTGRNRVTYGSMYGFSILKNTDKQAVAYSVISAPTDPASLSILNKISYLPPVRRDMIATGSTDPYQTIFYDSALISRGWLDANSRKTGNIFKDMLESITSGRSNMTRAIEIAHEELDISIMNP